MLKGKFYTGLPEKMMSRTPHGVDRQRTQFYWPDESEAEDRPIKNVKRSAASVPAAANNTKVDSRDIKPRELFHKQLTSGIEFYDNVNAKTPESRRRRFKKIENVNLNNLDPQFVPEKKKLETFSSKIEFYDFVDEAKLKDNRNIETKVPLKKPVEEDVKKRLPERSDSIKKRISFKPERNVSATKGILKNGEYKDSSNNERNIDIELTKVNVRSPVRKTGLARKCFSKSVENISKLVKDLDDDEEIPTVSVKKNEDLKSIVQDVKNLKLNEEKPKRIIQKSRYADFDDDDFNHREHTRTNNQRIETRHEESLYNREKNRNTTEEIPKKINHHISRDQSFDEYDKGNSSSRIINDRNSTKHSQKDQDEYYENRSTHRSDKVRRSPPRYDDDNNRYESRRSENNSRRYENSKPSPTRRNYREEEEDRFYSRRSPRNEPADYDRDAAGSNRRFSHDRVMDTKARERDDDKYSRSNNRYNSDFDDRRKTVDQVSNSGYERKPSNRRYSPDRSRANVPASEPMNGGGSHRHLRSTFSFSDNGYQPQQNRPLTVRQSAVHRVGVGLPDF